MYALVLPFVFLWKGMKEFLEKQENEMNEVKAIQGEERHYMLQEEAQPYAYLIDELDRLFKDWDCTSENVREEQHKSGNNINFVRNNDGATLISIRATEYNAYNGKKKFNFNSDSTGLAVGFRDDVLKDISTSHLQLASEGKGKNNPRQEKWTYYRIANAEDVQLLRA